MAVTKVFDTSKDGIFNEDFGNVFKSAEGALVWELRQDTRPCRILASILLLFFGSASVAQTLRFVELL